MKSFGKGKKTPSTELKKFRAENYSDGKKLLRDQIEYSNKIDASDETAPDNDCKGKVRQLQVATCPVSSDKSFERKKFASPWILFSHNFLNSLKEKFEFILREKTKKYNLIVCWITFR